MIDFKTTNLYKKSPIIFLTVLLFISIASALFMPAMFTFYIAFPILLIFVSAQNKYLFMILFLLIVLSFGIIYIMLFELFIYLFPTYIVLLTIILLRNFIPIKIKSSKISLLSLFFISILLGLNTNIIDIFQSKHLVEEKINSAIYLNQEDIIKIIGNNTEFPSTYNSYDFITFGANEAVGGLWQYPKIETDNLLNLLQQREISYTYKNKSPYTIDISSSKNNNKHIVNIQIKSNTKLLSSLKIMDQLPYQSSINKEELDNFDQRLEYLLRHNIWNMLLFFSSINSNINNSSVINNFLDKSIKSTPKKANWNVSTLDFNSTVLFKSDKQECTSYPTNDYNNYPFSQWIASNQYNRVKLAPEANYIFDINNTIYATKDHSTPSIPWFDNHFAYSIDEYIYIFFTFESRRQNIRVLKFTKKGQFVNQYNIHLPKDMNLEGRDWHPISHVDFINDKMKLRLYNIYEYKKKSETAAPISDQCSFYELETKSLAD